MYLLKWRIKLDNSSENNKKVLEMLEKINNDITDEVITNASAEDLAGYFEMITRTNSKVKNLD